MNDLAIAVIIAWIFGLPAIAATWLGVMTWTGEMGRLAPAFAMGVVIYRGVFDLNWSLVKWWLQ